MTTHWSHSQLSLWQGCGKRFELDRVKRYPTPPAWYLVGGKAIHRATERYDRGHLQEAIEARWDLNVEMAYAMESGLLEEDWLAAGYGQNKQRFDHWKDKVVEHTQRWIDFREESPHLEIVSIEEEVSYGEGEREIKAYLDRVFFDHDADDLLLVDIKSSSKRPESKQQLGIYRALWNHKYPDRLLHRGHYFMTKDGGFAPKDGDLTNWGLDTLDKMGDVWSRAKSSRIYLPIMSSGCETCSVKDACYVKSGDTKTTREYDSLNPNFQGES